MFPTGNIARWLALPRRFFPTLTTTALLLLALFPARGDALQGTPTAPGAQGASTGIEGEMQPLNVVEHDDPAILSPRELIVKFRQGVGRANREAALAFAASRVEHFADHNHGPQNRPGRAVFEQLVQVRLHDGIAPLEAIAELEQDPLVEYAELNRPVHILENFPNDPDFERLWGLDNTGQTGGTADADIDAPGAWETTQGSSDVVVAVIDTGIEYTHPDLAANMWVNRGEIAGNGIDDDNNGFVDDVHGYDFFNNDPDPLDDHFHGTHCAGTIGAVGNNGIGVAGVNWAVQLMAVKFLSASGSGDTAGAVSAIQYAINNGADVMSNSWGGSGYSQALQDVIVAAHDAGIVFVAAAGNSGNNDLFYPAAHEKVIAVSATDDDDLKASFSSWGGFVDLAAPGVNIYSTKLNGAYGPASGTSMACPHVAGQSALLLSLDPSLTPGQVKSLLASTADDLGDTGWDPLFGAGRINTHNAVQTVLHRDTSFPTADLASPTQGEVVGGASVAIAGTAAGDAFADYVVEYASPAGGPWQLIGSSTSPVQDGLLASWDTTEVPDGEYLIRATVTDQLGRSLYDVVQVILDSFDVAIDLPTQLVSMDTVDVLGSATTKNGMPFSHYTLEWGVGSAPSAFSTDGITLLNDGSQPVSEGKLASWDTSALLDGQMYTLRLRLYPAAGTYVQTSVQTQADRDLLEGWPKLLAANSAGHVAPTVADLDGDGEKEVIVAGPGETIRVYRKDGSLAPGFPLATNAGEHFQWGVNVDDLDGDGTQEIIAVVENRVLIVNHDGTFYDGWPRSVLTERQGASDLTPSVADLDGDGNKELVTIELITQVGRTEARLHALALDGTERPGFPKSLVLPDDLYPAKHGVPVIADLDRDAHQDIVWSHSDRIYRFDHEGNLVEPQWPFIAPRYNGKIMLFENTAATGDIDGDGDLEVFAIARAAGCGGCETQLYALDEAGFVLSGWPKSDQTDDIMLWNTTTTQNTPVSMDLDGDNKDEVVVGLGRLAVFDEDGAEPFATGASPGSYTQAAASDVDGDGRLEFSANRYNVIGVVDDDGSDYWKRAMPGGGKRNTLGIFADLEGDGFQELAVAHTDPGGGIALYLWEIPRSGASLAAGEWRQFNHDPARSARLGGTPIDPPEDSVPPQSEIDAPADGSRVSGVISVLASASDNVGVTLVKFFVGDTLIGADSSAPYTVPWDTTASGDGTHSLAAEAYDAAGHVGGDAITVTVDNAPPGAPTLLLPANGSTTTDTTPTFEWAAVSDPSGVTYQLQVDGDPDFSSPEVDVGDLGGSTYTQKQELGAGTHSWRARTFDGADNVSGWSAVWTVTIDAPPPPEINAPSDLHASASGRAVTLTWQDNSGNEEGFIIERGSKVRGQLTYSEIARVSANAPYVDTVSPGTYHYRVRAFNETEGLFSDYSNTVSVKVTGK